MEYQKIKNLLDNASNKSSNFRTKNWVEISDDSGGTCSSNKQIKFKTSLLKSSLCDYSDGYILVQATITVNNTETTAASNNRNKNVIFKNCPPFTNCISKINNTQIDDDKDIDIVMPI